MKMYTVFLGLGSNVGERQKFLNKAAAEIKKLPVEEVAAITTANAQKIFGG